MKLSIVIPIYEELDNIDPLHAQLTEILEEFGRDYEIIFSNDGSKDGSAEALDRAADGDPRTKVIHLRRNFGQTAALMAGFNHASGEIVLAMDGDLQNDPKDIPRLVDEIEKGFDVVSGWRIDRKEGQIRRLPSRIANWLISRVTGVKLHDYGCTLKAYRRDALQGVYLYGEMHRFIPALVAWQGGTVTELPVSHHARRHGASKYGIDRTTRVILDLFVVYFLGRGVDRPIQFFGKAGIYSIVAALLAGIWAVYLKYVEGVSFIQTPLPILVALLILTALIFLLMGLLAEMQTRIYFETQQKFPYVIRETRNMVPENEAENAR
jgi:glycosyltransferase involved in cell wall biosynthesis